MDGGLGKGRAGGGHFLPLSVEGGTQCWEGAEMCRKNSIPLGG